MSPKVALSILVFSGAAFASAQSVNVSFPEPGDRQVWIASGPLNVAPGDSDGIHVLQTEAAVLADDAKPDANIYVWDRKTGNLAWKALKDAKSGWSVKPEDYQAIGVVDVRVEHLGKPVAGGIVDLDDGVHKSSHLLVAKDNGDTKFADVKPGSLKITVHFKVGSKDAEPVTQLLDAPLKRSDPTPTATISLADAVDTVGPASGSSAPAAGGPTGDAAATSSSSSPKKGEEGGSIIGNIITYLVILGAMIAAIYYGIRYMKSNPDSVASKLEQLGVQIPKPGADPLTSPAPVPMPKAPAPVQKIILDDAAPDPIAPMSASTAVSDPRLVSQSGDVLPLPEGELTVGREVGMGLSLVGESTVSRKHAQLTRSGGSVVVKDFGSTNGTFVNGVQIQGEKQLQIGDTVQFGSVRFRFEG